MTDVSLGNRRGPPLVHEPLRAAARGAHPVVEEFLARGGRSLAEIARACHDPLKRLRSIRRLVGEPMVDVVVPSNEPAVPVMTVRAGETWSFSAAGRWTNG